MIFKVTIWVCVLMFISTVYNVVAAYTGMSDMNVQDKFQEIGLLHDGKSEYPLPPKKPVNLMAAL